jgi:hypothetical protein
MFMPVPKSESPMRETRHSSGKKQFHGEDKRNIGNRHFTDRGVVHNAFLEDDEPNGGEHVGDGMDHTGRKAVSAPIMPKMPLPVSNQESADMHAQSVSGGPAEVEHHHKTWSDGPLGVKHLDPPASKEFAKKSVARMKKKGTVGSLTKIAKSHGYSSALPFAHHVMADKKDFSPKVVKKSNWAVNINKG